MSPELYISLVYKNLDGIITDQEFEQLNKATIGSNDLALIRSEIEAVWDNSGNVPIIVSPKETRDLAKAIIEERKRPTKTFRFFPLVSGLAAVLVLAIVAILTFKNSTKTFDKAGSILLADGTNVILRSNSELKVFSFEKERIVQLKGEARFNVTKDKSRPFIVKTTRANVAVLGTQFLIKDRKTATQVYLIEGSVQATDNRTNETIVLSPAMSATVGNGAIVIDTLGQNNLTSWIDGVYEYDNVRLENVLDELSHIFDVEVVLSNTQLSDCALSGVINAETITDALDALVARYNISYIFRDGKVIVNEGVCK